MIVVRPVDDRRGWRAFRKVPRVVYRDDPHWIPGDLADLNDTLIKPTPEVQSRIDTRSFVAYDGKNPVGRITGIADHAYIELYREPVAFFGFFESIDSDDVAFALLDAVGQWALERSLTRLCGPLSPSMLYSAGFLIGGIDAPPLVGMPHNPRYYADLVEAWGLKKAKDFHSYHVDNPHQLLMSPAFERKTAMANRWRERSSVRIRCMDPKTFEEDIEIVRGLYNAAFGDFWGYTPIAPDELLGLANEMKPILDPELVLIAEIDGAPVAFLMGIPDINRAAVKARRWRSRTMRDLQTIVLWKGPGGKKLRSHVRADMMVVHPECTDLGVASLMIYELYRRLDEQGYSSVEAAPVLEDGGWITGLKKMHPVEAQREYRVYQGDIPTGLHNAGVQTSGIDA